MGAERIIFLALIDFIVIVNYIYNVTGSNLFSHSMVMGRAYVYACVRDEVGNVNPKEERNLFIL